MFRKKTAKIHPFVTISLIIILILCIGGIIYIWNSIGHRAGQAILIQNVKEQDAKIIIYVQNIGENPVLLEIAQIDSEKITITPDMCSIAGELTNLLPINKTALITIEKNLAQISQIKVYVKGGAQALWVP